MIIRQKTIIMTMVLSLVVSGLFLAPGCATNPITGKRELSLISEEDEIRIGTEAAPQFEKEFGGAVPDATLQNYVKRVGASLAEVSHREMPYEYTLVASEIPNAFALPGGKIFLTSGLMARMTNERQLAAVLGHETAHVSAKHNVKGMQRQMGAQVLVAIAQKIVSPDSAAAAGAAAQVVTGMASLKYSRNDEYEADHYGAIYMERAGYNPWGMVELQDILLKMSGDGGGTFTEMFQTHPLPANRIVKVGEFIESDSRLEEYSKNSPDRNAGVFLSMRARLLRVVPGLKASLK